MIPPEEFRRHVIRPVLSRLARFDSRLGGAASEQLMLGTALAESRLGALEQRGGPALSMFQIEPATFTDIYGRYLRSRPGLLAAVRTFRLPGLRPLEQLAGNQHLACAIARVKYWMDPRPLPAPGDIDAFGAYWKAAYNTSGGAGKASRWAHLYRKYVREGVLR